MRSAYRDRGEEITIRFAVDRIMIVRFEL